MGKRTVPRILALLTGILLVGVLILGVSVIKQRISAPAPANEAAEQIDTAEVADGSRMGPFILRLTYPKIGSQSYVSFHVYYSHDGTEELWYSCGRMFAAADTQSIDWTGTQYDIAVTLKNGKQELFSYDGNSSWL